MGHSLLRFVSGYNRITKFVGTHCRWRSSLLDLYRAFKANSELEWSSREGRLLIVLIDIKLLEQRANNIVELSRTRTLTNL